ncbi:methyltransferase [Brachybacterium paraconglomeratum]|uniref:methyltransferase n=1 Tax=Brachybacterium paraconglomeratum TaxID=173362 RepID=UPI0031EBCBD9
MGQITHELVLEVLDGCGASALQEASTLGFARLVGPTELVLSTSDLDAVRGLRRVVAASTSLTVPARRPRELLETSVQQRFGELLEDVRRQRPRIRFHGLRLEAAGSDTPDMRRLASALAELAEVPFASDGDLVVRVRRGAPSGTWQLLLRTTPRPLSTRAWRTVDYPGAVNATIAATVLDQLQVGAEDSLLDMTCGSGTFLVEQLHDVAPARAVGVDLNADAIDAAREHQRVARRKGKVDWLVGDVLDVDLEPGFTRLVTNPPWGTLHGDHETNEELLAALLGRAAELAAPQARLGVLTHEITRMQQVLETAPAGWRPVGEHRFFQKGHHPRLFLLERG